MEKHSIRSFKIQWYILVLLLVSLTTSMALNAYLYFKATKPSYEYERRVFIGRVIQGGMGQVGVSIDKGLWLGVGYEFNVSVGVGLWEPYIGSSKFRFTFSLYERTLHGEYSHAPIAEKNVTVQKHKDVMYVNAGVLLNITAPLDPGIYIYRVVIEGAFDYEFEFPILVELGGPIIGPIGPFV